jgi:hypothetical protein
MARGGGGRGLQASQAQVPCPPPLTPPPKTSNCSRDRGLRAFLEAFGAVCVLFWLSWRLAPAVSIVILVTALAAAHYRKRTRPVEQAQGRALQRMGAVAHQAFENMRTVRSFAGEALERERFQAQAAASYSAGREFGRAKANFEATNRAAIHASLLMLYSWGGYLVSQGLMPISVLISGIGFTFSLMYATQGAVNTLSDLRRAAGAFERVRGRARRRVGGPRRRLPRRGLSAGLAPHQACRLVHQSLTRPPVHPPARPPCPPTHPQRCGRSFRRLTRTPPCSARCRQARGGRSPTARSRSSRRTQVGRRRRRAGGGGGPGCAALGRSLLPRMAGRSPPRPPFLSPYCPRRQGGRRGGAGGQGGRPGSAARVVLLPAARRPAGCA